MDRQAERDNAMKTVTFHMTAVQPLLLTSLQGDPNSSVSFPYVPGSVIRGALIGQYCQGKVLNLEDLQVQRWFFDGTTRYLHAYPLVDRMRTVPVPRVLAAEKMAEWEHEQLQVYDRSVARPPSTALRSLTGFLARDRRGTLKYTATRMLVNIHNQRDRLRGRGVEGAGAVFRYEAIAPEQTFAAAILCADHDAAMIRSLVPARLWVGGSRSAGYGEVRIDNLMIVDHWSEIQPSMPGNLPEDDDAIPVATAGATRLVITLTSDMILRAAHGGYTTEPPNNWISALLGIRLTLDDTHTMLGTVLHGGFNRTWGLPVPQMPALAAGSVLTYTCDTRPTAADLARLEAEGLETVMHFESG
jgi:CRISPR-associated protein Csx10